MSQLIHDKQIFTLSEVTQSIRKTLSERYKSAYWIKTEMNKLNFYHQSGHCYPELVEKKEGKIAAQIRATLWSENYKRINLAFKEITNEPLKDGMKILILAHIQYDPVHGLSLLIKDIDPSFTLGDLEKEKQICIKRLKEENVYNRNKLIPFPLIPSRIAIISVETSKGYADFMSVIKTNPWQYKFFTMLFPAILQGDKSAESILFQLNQIKKVHHHFDAVAIIRGGGGDIGLSCYNDYTLAKEVCTFPLPVLSGIGHSTNETVCELVAAVNAITPTQCAEILIQHFHNVAVPLQQGVKFISQYIPHLITNEQKQLNQQGKWLLSTTRKYQQTEIYKLGKLVQTLHHESINNLRTNQHTLNKYQQKMTFEWRQFYGRKKTEIIYQIHTLLRPIPAQFIAKKQVFSHLLQQLNNTVTHQLSYKKKELNQFENQVQNLNPAQILKRGFSITRINGKAITKAKSGKKGDTMVTILYQGKINSIIQ